jgi:hypothetical protein
MEDSVAEILRSLRTVVLIGTDGPNVFEHGLVTSIAGVGDEPTHRKHNDRSSTAIDPTRQGL